MNDVHPLPLSSVYQPDGGAAIPVQFTLCMVVTPQVRGPYYQQVAARRFTCLPDEIEPLRRELRSWALGELTPRRHPLGLYLAAFTSIEYDEDGEPDEGYGYREEPVCWDGDAEIPAHGYDIHPPA